MYAHSIATFNMADVLHPNNRFHRWGANNGEKCSAQLSENKMITIAVLIIVHFYLRLILFVSSSSAHIMCVKLIVFILFESQWWRAKANEMDSMRFCHNWKQIDRRIKKNNNNKIMKIKTNPKKKKTHFKWNGTEYKLRDKVKRMATQKREKSKFRRICALLISRWVRAAINNEPKKMARTEHETRNSHNQNIGYLLIVHAVRTPRHTHTHAYTKCILC